MYIALCNASPNQSDITLQSLDRLGVNLAYEYALALTPLIWCHSGSGSGSWWAYHAPTFFRQPWEFDRWWV